ERNLLPSAFSDLQIDVDRSLFVIGFEIGVLVFVDWFKISKLIQLNDGIFPGILIVNVTFVNQHLATQNVIACKCVANELQATKGKLLTFFNGDSKVDYSLIWILRTVLKRRRWLCRVFNKTLRTVNLLQVLEESFSNLF